MVSHRHVHNSRCPLIDSPNKELTITWSSSSDEEEHQCPISTHESPVLGNRLLRYSYSPIKVSPDSSPVIGKSRLLKKIKHVCEHKDAKRLIIEDPNSQREKGQIGELCIVSDDGSFELFEESPEKVEQFRISPVSSQEFLEIVSTSSSEIPAASFSNNDSVVSSSLRSNKNIKNKKTKTRGLVSQLQKALLKQSSDQAMWLHEVYICNKRGIPFAEVPAKIFKIQSVFNEYGCTVFLCKVANCQSDTNCLIVTCKHIADKLSLDVQSTIELYNPFLVKTVFYKGSLMECYYNVTKIK